MKSVKYIKFEPDSLIKPLWLSQVFMLLFEILTMVLLLIPIYYFLSHFDMVFAHFFILVVALILIIVLTTDVLLNIIKQTKIVDEMYLSLPRKQLEISDITKLKIYKMRHLTGEISCVDIFLKNSKCYSVSIFDIDKFVEILLNLNSQIEVVDTTKIQP